MHLETKILGSIFTGLLVCAIFISNTSNENNPTPIDTVTPNLLSSSIMKNASGLLEKTTTAVPSKDNLMGSMPSAGSLMEKTTGGATAAIGNAKDSLIKKADERDAGALGGLAPKTLEFAPPNMKTPKAPDSIGDAMKLASLQKSTLFNLGASSTPALSKFLSSPKIPGMPAEMGLSDFTSLVSSSASSLRAKAPSMDSLMGGTPPADILTKNATGGLLKKATAAAGSTKDSLMGSLPSAGSLMEKATGGATAAIGSTKDSLMGSLPSAGSFVKNASEGVNAAEKTAEEFTSAAKNTAGGLLSSKLLGGATAATKTVLKSGGKISNAASANTKKIEIKKEIKNSGGPSPDTTIIPSGSKYPKIDQLLIQNTKKTYQKVEAPVASANIYTINHEASDDGASWLNIKLSPLTGGQDMILMFGGKSKNDQCEANPPTIEDYRNIMKQPNRDENRITNLTRKPFYYDIPLAQEAEDISLKNISDGCYYLLVYNKSKIGSYLLEIKGSEADFPIVLL